MFEGFVAYSLGNQGTRWDDIGCCSPLTHQDSRGKSTLGKMLSRLTQETVGPQVVLGVIGANSCPESFSKITSWPLCLASLDIAGPGNPDIDTDAIAGYEFDSVENDPDWPAGCYN